jgi:hypothetical protein
MFMISGNRLKRGFDRFEGVEKPSRQPLREAHPSCMQTQYSVPIVYFVENTYKSSDRCRVSYLSALRLTVAAVADAAHVNTSPCRCFH